MVIILQQTTENGNRFISTVVDTPQDSSFTSSFSQNSQLSISERSAVYKQRIDSLFGRPSRLSSFNPNGEPFRIRIDGKSISPSEGLMGSNHLSSSVTAASTALLREENEGRILSTSEDDEYSRIKSDKPSVIPDSLNHQGKVTNKKSIIHHSGNNVSSVRITCEDSESSGTQLPSLMLTSSSGEEATGRSEAHNNQIMWKNSNYGEISPPTNVINRVEKPFSTVRCSPGGMLKFSVEYLGSVPVSGNTAALQDLQIPLRSLYMNYLTNRNMMAGQLAITSDGLRFEAPKIRLVNPFTTIAVWAAVKFVGRGDPAPTECAFMPLISDPEGQDKSRLFGRMDSELCSVYQGCIGDPSRNFKNPPIFACVMREATFSLDCHAFACKCAEDAIVIAANLYQSLVDKMRTGGKEGESGYGSLTRGSPATQSSMNQNRSSSSASSNTGNSKEVAKSSGSGSKHVLTQTPSSSSTQNESRAVFSDSESIIPVRPPRRKKKISEIPPGNLKRYNSDDSVLLNLPYRRRSFKAAYQGHYIKNKKRVQIHTPDESSSGDSFSDSVDQILDRIVNPCGMSFNDLKPAYQELILKIALTLTQDQLYKKSKQAMKKQQQKSRKKQKSATGSAEASDDNSQFMNQFLKSISKITMSGKATGSAKLNTSKTAVLTSGINARQKQNKGITVNKVVKTSLSPSKAILKKTKDDEAPFMSFCSGCVCEKCSDKCYCSLPSKPAGDVGGIPPTPTSSTSASTPSQHPVCSSAAETDVPRSKKSCGYDTDSCAESEKCYCSLQRVKSNGLKIYNINLDTETSDTDTNSYDLEHFNNSQLSENFLINKSSPAQRPVEILSYHPSRRLSYCFSPTQSQKSYAKDGSPVLHINTESENRHDKPSQFLSKKSPKKYRDLNILENAQLSKNKVLLITGSNASGQVVYKDNPFSFRQGVDFGDGLSRRIDPSRRATKPDHLSQDDNNVTADDPCPTSTERKPEFAPEKVLSMKKTAEIAAMFTELKLHESCTFPLNDSSDLEEITVHQESTSIDFETSLGYLP